MEQDPLRRRENRVDKGRGRCPAMRLLRLHDALRACAFGDADELQICAAAATWRNPSVSCGRRWRTRGTSSSWAIACHPTMCSTAVCWRASRPATGRGASGTSAVDDLPGRPTSGCPDRWLEDEAIQRELPEGDLGRIYRDLRGIVSRKDQRRPRVRAYGGGIPQVFLSPNGTGVGDLRVRDLMFPDDLWRNRRTHPAQSDSP